MGKGYLDMLSHAPILLGGAAYVYESPLGASCLVMNIHNPFMHCVSSQYMFKLCDVIMVDNGISVPTITYATASPCHIPLKACFTKIQQCNGTNFKFKKNK